MKNQETASADEDVQQREPSAQLVGKRIGAAAVDRVEAPREMEGRNTTGSSSSTAGRIPKRNENTALEGPLPPCVH